MCKRGVHCGRTVVLVGMEGLAQEAALALGWAGRVAWWGLVRGKDKCTQTPEEVLHAGSEELKVTRCDWRS